MKMKRIVALLCVAAMTFTGVAVMPFALPVTGNAYAAQTEDQNEEGTKADDAQTVDQPETEVQDSVQATDSLLNEPMLDEVTLTTAENGTYSAVKIDGKPGVYSVTPELDSSGNINIPSLTNLSKPTSEMPAIITGAAVNYEMKTGPTSFQKIPGAGDIQAPYKYFRWKVIDEQAKDADGNVTTHKKMSGYDGSYYIVRVDVSNIIGSNYSGKYLHVKQENNKAQMVAVGMASAEDQARGIQSYTNMTGTDQVITQTVSISLDEIVTAMKDGDPSGTTPYFDVILVSSSKIVSGGDAQKEGAANGDVNLSFYMDTTGDYNPPIKELDPNNMPTFPYTAADGVTYQTEADYTNALLAKYYRDEYATSENNACKYSVKGSDLGIDVAIDQNKSESDKDSTLTMPVNWMEAHAEFWSMEKAIANPQYDDQTIMLICEVPVLSNLEIKGSGGRSVILDVNSFDIQIANNKKDTDCGLVISGNSSLRIKDGTNTSGAELAVGNNARMLIEKGGVLIIDESCTTEAEYDAATTLDPKVDPGAGVFSGEITVADGGTLINYGVVNIEGCEAKPVDPADPAGQQVISDMKTATMLVSYGGTFDNYGCLSLKGVLYVLGTLNNYGRYDDIINANDPDKGTTQYHKGIQITWKDVVTKPGVEPGVLNIGIDAGGNVESSAKANNYGDIVLCPGTINNYGTFYNSGESDRTGRVYLCTMNEAIIPIVPSQADPLTIEKRITLDPPKESFFNNYGTLINRGIIGRATVELIHNGVLGKLTPIEDVVSPTAPGTEHVVSGNRYVVLTDATDTAPGTVALVKAKNTKHVKVPASIMLNGKRFLVVQVNAKAFKGTKIRIVTLGKNIVKLQKNAFYKSRCRTIIVKTKKLTKKSVKGSLRGSQVNTVRVKVGSSETNKKYVKKYRKIFTKENCGKKVTVRR